MYLITPPPNTARKFINDPKTQRLLTVMSSAFSLMSSVGLSMDERYQQCQKYVEACEEFNEAYTFYKGGF